MDSPIPLELPPGNAWAVGVSGGADSVALLLRLAEHSGLQLRVAHLDHELRGEASRGDAIFVEQLAKRLGVPCDAARISEIALDHPPANPSARYRAARLAFFNRVVQQHNLDGVTLAHHADDVAETVLHRLIRGSGPSGLGGISSQSMIGGLRIARPLLNVRRESLRAMLLRRGQDWREDASNQTDDYLRNRLRKVLAHRPALTDSLLQLSAACRQWSEWADSVSPRLESVFPAEQLAALPPMLARQSARRWLLSAGAPPEKLSSKVLDRLIVMAADAAAPRLDQFPGRVVVRRKSGRIAPIDKFD
jgi:tRNA(Ile)-lysidine synthase